MCTSSITSCKNLEEGERNECCFSTETVNETSNVKKAGISLAFLIFAQDP